MAQPPKHVSADSKSALPVRDAGSAPPGRSALWLGVTLILAAALRFTGLSWGLRHTPYHDERYFVENTAQMVVHRDLDHRFYEYPGLVFYLFLPFFAWIGVQVPPGPEAYFVARAIVAGFGVLSVALVYRLGTRLLGARAGLVAALFLAVSPLDVETAHMVRPDVILQCFVLMALLAFARIGPALGPDLLSGVALGAASAVKFTGGLLAPSYLVYRWLAPGPRLRRSLLVALLAGAVLVILTPYAVLNHRAFLGGVSYQWTYHYRGEGGTREFFRLLLFYLRAIVETLGPVGAGLAAAGAFLVRSQRRWWPLLLHLTITLLLSSIADRAWQRFLVPSMGVLVLLVAKGLEAFRARFAWWGPVLLAAGLMPLWSSIGYVRYTLEPGAWDRALDWVESQVVPGSRIVNAFPALGLDRSRFEVIPAPARAAAARLVARQADVLIIQGVASQAASAVGFREVFRASSTRDDPAIAIYRVPEDLKPRYQPVTLERQWLTASENQGLLAGLLDDDPATAWTTVGPQRAGSWIQVALPDPTVLGRIELGLGNRPARYGRDIQLLATPDGQSWRRIEAYAGRAPFEHQRARKGERSDVLVFEPQRVRGVKLVQTAAGKRRWSVARLRLEAVP